MVASRIDEMNNGSIVDSKSLQPDDDQDGFIQSGVVGIDVIEGPDGEVVVGMPHLVGMDDSDDDDDMSGIPPEIL